MKNFRVEVSKWVEKFTFVRQAEAELFLRETLHKEGFTILSVSEIWNIKITWNKFYFDFIKDWVEQTWTIASQDIFKSYVKIKYSLWYNLKYIYQEKETSIEEKEKILHELESQYEIFQEVNKKKHQKREEALRQKVAPKDVKEKDESFYLQKKLDYVYNILDKSSEKIKIILTLDDDLVDFEKKEKLKTVYNELTKLKSSTNIAKLKEVWELALLKVWEIELDILTKKKDIEYKTLLKDTNKLLKKIWSKKEFREESKKISVILWTFILNSKRKVKYFFSKNKVDTSSTSYLKLKLSYDRYQEQLKELNSEIIIHIGIYFIPTKSNKQKVKEYKIRKKVIKQNITILKKRITNQPFSYTKIVKWYKYIISKLVHFFVLLKEPLLILDILYSFMFITLYVLEYFWVLEAPFNYNWLFYFIYLNIVILLLSLSRGLFLMILKVVFLIILFIFWVINF